MNEQRIDSDLAAVARIAAVPVILEALQDLTGSRVTLVARVTPDRCIAAAVRDSIGFGLDVGSEFDVTTTLCAEVREPREPVVIEDVAKDAVYRNHRMLRAYGLASYFAYPLYRQSGEYFGTLCGLDKRPLNWKDERTLKLLHVLADLFSLQLEAQERHEADVVALREERASSERRDQFLAVLGHDVRTPLSAVALGIGLLERELSSDGALRVIERIKRSTQRIAALLESTLDLARGRRGGGIAIETMAAGISSPGCSMSSPRCGPCTRRPL